MPTDGDDLKSRIEALEKVQTGQAATMVGAQATQAAIQAGIMATMAAGSVSLIVGIFLGLSISKSRRRG